MFASVGANVWDVNNGVYHVEKSLSVFYHFSFYVEVSLVLMVFAMVKTNLLRFKIVVIIAFIISMFTVTRQEFENVLIQDDENIRKQLTAIEADIAENQRILDSYLKFDMLTKSEPVQNHLRELRQKKEELIAQSSEAINIVALKEFLFKLFMFLFLQFTNVFSLHLFFRLLENKPLAAPKEKFKAFSYVDPLSENSIVPVLRGLSRYIPSRELAKRIAIEEKTMRHILANGTVSDAFAKQRILKYFRANHQQIRALINRKKTFYLT
jgi:hypothetical protein